MHSDEKGRNVPGCKGNNRADYNSKATFYQVFGSGSTKELRDIMANQSSNPEECTWITAVFNSMLLPNFPYSTTEVYGLYNSTKRADAQVFFADFAE